MESLLDISCLLLPDCLSDQGRTYWHCLTNRELITERLALSAPVTPMAWVYFSISFVVGIGDAKRRTSTEKGDRRRRRKNRGFRLPPVPFLLSCCSVSLVHFSHLHANSGIDRLTRRVCSFALTKTSSSLPNTRSIVQISLSSARTWN